MPVKIKSGGVWRDCADGSLRIRAGGAWQRASFCRIKSGGNWQLSSYRSYPGPPGAIGVSSWDFSNVNLYWGAATTGAPVIQYHVVQTDAGGNWINQWFLPSTQTTLNGIGVSQNQATHFYVRSYNSATLFSDWAGGNPSNGNGGVGVQIGHNEQGHVQNDPRYRDWSGSVGFQGGIHRDEAATIFVPASISMTSWRYIAYLNFPGTYISYPPPANRWVHHVFRGARAGAEFQWLDTFIDITEAFPNTNGENNYWGIIPGGNGWSTVDSNDVMLQGALYIYGFETYYVQVYYVDVAYAGNNYIVPR